MPFVAAPNVKPVDRTAARVELWLARHAETAWRESLRPWFEAGRGRLERSFVVVPTRGQAQALKQRCLVEGVSLLGVEFLTPGLARQKWLALRGAEQGPGVVARPAMGRELLLLGLRVLIAGRLAPLSSSDKSWGFWKSLQSDPERALDDFDDLLKAGFRAKDFPLPELSAIFAELVEWVEACGYSLAALEAEAAGLALLKADAPAVGARVLVHLPGPEMWGEFFNMAAFVRRCPDVTVVLPEPAFRGRSDLDERWVTLWSSLLGVEALSIDAQPPAHDCESVGQLWSGQNGSATAVRVRVGRTRGEEMEAVAHEAESLVAAGAENIAIVFPRADASHLYLAQALHRRGVVFSDLLETAGPPPADVQVQHALLAFHAKGGRLEELLDAWPLLRALGSVTRSTADVRRRCERSFDLRQTHAVEVYVDEWKQREPELARVATALLPVWPDELTLIDAMTRFHAMCAALEVAEPEGWTAIEVLARSETRALPKAAVIAALASFLPDRQPLKTVRGRNVFARVTIGTRRRLEAVAWSHVIFVECNAGVWPEPHSASCWLTDEDRRLLNERSRFSLGLFTSDDRRLLERSAYLGLARDTAESITFTAALADEADPEVRLSPNAWLERVIWAKGWAGEGADIEAAFSQRVERASPPEPESEALDHWCEVWNGRRDPNRPFDDFFFGGDPAVVTPASLSARQIERGIQDPAELWFEAVLGVTRTPWEPLVRARRKALGLWAHDLLAGALSAHAEKKGFGEMPDKETSTLRLQAGLDRLRALWPDDHYWQSFRAELARVAFALLDNLHTIAAGPYVATERNLPDGAHLKFAQRTLPVKGRMDLVRLDRRGWLGATVDIVDFKTGGDLALSAKRMAASGSSLQLAIYLSAVLSVGAADGRVWMIKTDPGAVACLEASELTASLTKLAWLDQAIEGGVYGALTRDRSDYAPSGYVWPLACTPVPESVLRSKFALTFGDRAEKEAGDDA